MEQAKNGGRVKVHYAGRLEDGQVFDSSEDRQPLEFTIGTGQVIAGFDKGIIGMGIGEKKTITIPPEQAYGRVRQELIRTLEKSRLPGNIFFAVGERVRIPRPDGTVLNAVVKDLDDNTVTLDANHPFAGKTLIFDLELMSVA